MRFKEVAVRKVSQHTYRQLFFACIDPSVDILNCLVKVQMCIICYGE